MRQPDTIERLYLDFDGFFASVMQQCFPRLRGRPVGVIPFETQSLRSVIIIACSCEAKAAGCTSTMRAEDALSCCPDMVFVPQRPDLYRRAHNALLNEIRCVIPIETVKSIDELSCTLDRTAIADPQGLARQVKVRLAENVGPYITCSIGFAANRLLAKMACKMDKPDGVTIWNPADMPGPLLPQPLDAVPGIGRRSLVRLQLAGILSMADLWVSQPKHLRAIWGNVTGERLWYAVHGYDIHAEPTGRGMYGHGRVLPPGHRTMAEAQACSRLLLVKAARRMRRDGYFAGALMLWLACRNGNWSGHRELPDVQDDPACLEALASIWRRAVAVLPANCEVIRMGVTLADLSPANARQLDMFLNDDRVRQRCEKLSVTLDQLNQKFGKRVVSIGPWAAPGGAWAGAKIAYTRIPSAEDFW